MENDDITVNYFALNLKYLRQKHNIEQLELAEKLGRKSSSSISEWEKGRYTPKAGILNDIAKIFNVPLSKLMNEDLSQSETASIDKLNQIISQIPEQQQEQLLKLAKYDLDNISLEILEILSKTDENFKNDMLVYTKFKYLEYKKLEEEKNVDNRNTAS